MSEVSYFGHARSNGYEEDGVELRRCNMRERPRPRSERAPHSSIFFRGSRPPARSSACNGSPPAPAGLHRSQQPGRCETSHLSRVDMPAATPCRSPAAPIFNCPIPRYLRVNLAAARLRRRNPSLVRLLGPECQTPHICALLSRTLTGLAAWQSRPESSIPPQSLSPRFSRHSRFIH